MNGLLAHVDTNLVTLADLAKVETPTGTKTWTPTAHADIPDAITKMVKESGLKFKNRTVADRFQLAVTPNGNKMFGITELVVPGVDVASNGEFGIVVGFRNSHNKSMALRFAIGTSVFVCDNMVLSGDFYVRREHTANISVLETTRDAFGIIPEAAKQVSNRFASMLEIPVELNDGVYFMTEAVKAGALPLADFMNAKDVYETAYEVNADSPDKLGDDEGDIAHGRMLWGAYQAITEQWKNRALLRLPDYSQRLNSLIKDTYGFDAGGLNGLAQA